MVKDTLPYFIMSVFSMLVYVFISHYHCFCWKTVSEEFRLQNSVVDGCGLCKQCLGQSSAFWAKFVAFCCIGEGKQLNFCREALLFRTD